MFLEIVTPVKKVYGGEVSIVTFPGVDGSFQVMNDHAAMVSTLKEGTVIYKNRDGQHEVEITGGVVEVLNNKIVLLADGLVSQEV
ncbi:ATP synthase epsilon chain [Fulvivirga imtechensis AK7]|uniref:ATP synthase epsilon chain n=1 Tax=Fulvivirga imtechensis AK7 TaxID=1237149 RepID=L8JPS9_9BACT|nr:ATP synthase F1 subunit epsilon [Fulvivirga imtechensis]ELR70966.1 ATP synthase epsilon chain [Fulvivirga imtechensis AK7]